MIKGINESKTLTKNILCDCKCRFNGKKFNLDQWWNTDKCWSECKNCHVCEKDYIWNFSRYSCKNTKYWANIMDDSAITCDEITEMDTETKSNDEAKSNDEEAKTIPTNFNEKNIRNFYILLALIAFSIYCYLIKYRTRHFTTQIKN